LKKLVCARRLLLVLDNCEHLLPACADLGETLLRRSRDPDRGHQPRSTPYRW
jgi:predicted ATPase